MADWLIHRETEETLMKKTLFSIAAASALMAGVIAASAQTTTTTTTTWSNDQGQVFEQQSTTSHYDSYTDSKFAPTVGEELPQSVTVHPLPETMHVPTPERYSYSIVNNRPVVVERTTRHVVYTWD
jgi:hypothetical protein